MAPSHSARPARLPLRLDGGVVNRIPADWRERFIRAYDIEFQEWIDAARSGGELGPSSWDGYAAAVVSDAALQARRTNTRVTVQLPDRHSLYAARPDAGSRTRGTL